MLDPCTVTETDPEAGRLPDLETLNFSISVVKAAVILSPRCENVRSILRDRFAPEGIRHATAVSEYHCDLSEAVKPTLLLAVYPTSPILDPCTVMDDDPVLARFDFCITLSDDESIVHTCVKLPTLLPAVTKTRLVPRRPNNDTRQVTQESEFHKEASHDVPASRSLLEPERRPNPAP